MIDVDVIDAAEEKELLAAWFSTVQFDKESIGLPPMEEEEDDEERARTHAILIQRWFEDTTQIVPRSLDPMFDYAHEDGAAWSYVDVGMPLLAAIDVMKSEAGFQELFGDIRGNPYHDNVGKFASKGGGGGAVTGEGDGHTLGTKFDTPVTKYGMKYSAAAAVDPRVKALKTDAAAWKEVPSEPYPLKGANLIATEEYLRSKPINKVVGGTEPFREGYDAHLLRTDEGDVIIDGHHRVAMYVALGRETMPAKVIDERTNQRGNPHHDKLGKFASGGGGGVATLDRKGAAKQLAGEIIDKYSKVEPSITPVLSSVAEQHGARMEGLDFRLKTKDSLARKLETKSAAKGLTVDEYGAKVGDALRYTMVAHEGNYSETSQAAIDTFREKGYKVHVENTWPPPPDCTYKGINTNMSKEGLTFEVQFHTDESLALKERQHGLYEVARSATASPAERRQATVEMLNNAADLPDPLGAHHVR